MSFTDDELAYLDSQTLGRLATVRPTARAQVSPVGFSYNRELGTIDIHGYSMSTSQKFRNTGPEPRAAFVVDDIASTRQWRVRCVEIRGVADAVLGPDGGAREGLVGPPHPPAEDHQLRRGRPGGRAAPGHAQPTGRRLNRRTAEVAVPSRPRRVRPEQVGLSQEDIRAPQSRRRGRTVGYAPRTARRPPRGVGRGSNARRSRDRGSRRAHAPTHPFRKASKASKSGLTVRCPCPSLEMSRDGQKASGPRRRSVVSP